MSAFSLVSIPPGSIELRDARTGIVRRVKLQQFEIGATAVTRRDLAQVRGDAAVSDQDPLHPVHAVTWFEAVAWCNDASRAHGLNVAYDIDGRTVLWDVSSDGYRLPTEAEWEWACRAGSGQPRYGPLEDIAWTSLDDLAGPQQVRGKLPNPYGLFDALGNVWEWCWDYADTARYADYRSLRGGGWDDKAWSVRASVRRGSAPDAVLEDVGFRVARGVVGEPGSAAAQGWSARADLERASVSGPLPVGWTPLRQ